MSNSSDNASDASKSFSWAMETETVHQDLYKSALEALKNNKVKGLPINYLVCPKCGNTYDAANVDDICGLCGTEKKKFIKIQ